MKVGDLRYLQIDVLIKLPEKIYKYKLNIFFKKETIKMTKKELIEKLNKLYNTMDIMFKDNGCSIEIKYDFKNNPFIKSAIVNFSDDFYRHFEEIIKNLGFNNKVKFNNTGDIFSIWKDSNTTEYN